MTRKKINGCEIERSTTYNRDIQEIRRRPREKERETVEKSCKVLKSRKIEDSEGVGEGIGWTARFLGSTCVPATKLAANGVTQLSHYWKLVTCTVPRAVTKAPPTLRQPSPILRVAVPVASVTQLLGRSNYVVAVRSHHPRPRSTLRTAFCKFVLFGSTYLRGIFYLRLRYYDFPSLCLPFASLSSTSYDFRSQMFVSLGFQRSSFYHRRKSDFFSD